MKASTCSCRLEAEPLMTLEEAIEHAEEKAKELGENTLCGRQHLQLAQWLKELQELREKK